MLLKPRFRCSEIDRIITCHGSRTLDTKFPTVSEDSEVSRLGTKIHAIGAVQLIATGAVGVATDPSPEIALEGFDAWILAFWVAAVRELVPPGWTIELESEMEVEFARFILTGHLDVLAYSPDGTEAIIIDLKTGFIPVEPADCNWQLAGYSALLRVVMPGVRRARLVIVQPRNNEDLGYPRISQAKVDFEQTDIEALLAFELCAVLDDPYTFETSKKACQYCNWPLTCPCTTELRHAMKTQLTKEAFDKLTPQPSLIQLAEWARDGKILEGPIKKARETIKERLTASKGDVTLDDGTRIYLKDSQTPRAVSDLSLLLMRVGLVVTDQKKVHACLSASLDDVERAVAAELKVPISSKKDGVMSGERWVETNLGDLITRKPTKTLVIS